MRHILLFLLLAPVHALPAQVELEGSMNGGDVIVQAKRAGAAGETLFQAIWRNVPGAKAVLQMQRPMAAPTERVMLDRLLETALGAYLDARIHFSKQGVVADLPAGKLAMEMNAMIFSTLSGLGVNSDMAGLSEGTRRQLDRLIRIDWSQARSSVDVGDGQDKYLAIYFYVRSQREELERQIRADLLPFATIAVLGDARVDHGRTVQVGSTCGTVYDEQNYLCALDLQLADTGSGGMDPELGAQMAAAIERAAGPAAEATAANERIRKRDRWLKAELDRINQRIDKIDQRKELWELRDRLDDIDDRLTGLEMEVRDAASDRRNSAAEGSATTSTVVTLHFARNSVQLGPENEALLNMVYERLLRSPMERVLITGHTDRTGDPKLNMRLSEQRARAVRDGLLQRGIAAHRLLMNHYGDSFSTGDPDQRRVEIEWLEQGR
jgi:outer membrane protein OmpA-like peptidoglycan-associated protein